MKNVIILAIVFFMLFFLYRSCTKGYDNYAYFVQVNDEAVFEKILSGDDARIIEHGRRLKIDIIAMDKDIDKANGPDQGAIRWYVCSGIDCDEGWQRSFKPVK
ncbi:MAG: hypothetical protein GY707_17690 [Desulfobacteraceae bacterium]|nr:hypothetical protein [Desulfobacteraceae bacterium]